MVVATSALALAWLLVPWTAAPAPPVDPTGGLPPDVVARAERVGAALRLPAVLSMVVGVVAVAVVVLSRPGRALLRQVRRLPGGAWTTVPAQVLLVVAVATLVRWPFGAWAEVVRRREGLSVRGWGGFTRDRLLAAGMEALLLAAAVLVVVLVARRLPRWWPAVAAALAACLVVSLSLLYPVLVDPVFVETEPLADGPVRQQVEELGVRAGAPVADVLVSDASARATTLNASVSGLGPTRRVVLQDTLLAAMPDDEVLAVVAHETAHAAAGDVWLGTLLGALGTAALVLVAGCVAGSLPGATTGAAAGARPGGSGGAGPDRAAWSGVGTPAGAGAVLLALTVLQLFATPAESLVSRQVERRADVVAVELTGDPGAYARAQQTLMLTNLADPSPPGWVQWWFGSHPTGAERVAAVR